LDFNLERCGSGAFEHDWCPIRWRKQDVCPQERALESGITPGPAYVGDMKASGGTEGKRGVGEQGFV